jgi:hypothetical protein
VIDEELARLPDKYWLPLVLCYLEGRTHEEAAHAQAGQGPSPAGWPAPANGSAVASPAVA